MKNISFVLKVVRHSIITVFFRNLQYSQENNPQTPKPATLLKGNPNTGVFLTIFRKMF